MLPEHSAAGQAFVQYLGHYLIGACPPALGTFVGAALLGEIGTARGRYPAHHLGCGEVLRVAADFPDPLVGFTPVLQGGVHEPGEPFPHRRHDLGGSVAELDSQGVENHPPDVVLLLVPGTIPDPDWPRPAVPGQVVQAPLGQVAFAADAVHDLKL